MNNQLPFKKVLIAPLDWGLGHATRCIPLIRQLFTLNCEVTVAASGASLALLKAEFNNITFLNVNGYDISYSKHKRWLPFKVFIQIPKILKAISSEHKWLKKLLQQKKFDAIISDNRFGFYSDKVYSVFISHQLQIQTNFKLVTFFLRKLNYIRINKFKECWVPDFEGDFNIAGILSHPEKLPHIPVKYLGVLSRFESEAQKNIKYKYFVIISGPEPQRTMFEEKMLAFAQSCNDKFLIVLGKPEQENNLTKINNCTVCNHLSTMEMEQAFAESEFVVSRSGYTTIMDILTLKKKSILIPTPGQTEQELLAKHLMVQKWGYTFLQDEDFITHFNKSKNFEYNLPVINSELYKDVIEEFVSSL